MPAGRATIGEVAHALGTNIRTLQRRLDREAVAFSDLLDRVRVRVLPDGRMTRRDAARYLGFSGKTLAMWALSKKGPPSVRMGWRCWYYIGDLDEYLRAVRTARG